MKGVVFPLIPDVDIGSQRENSCSPLPTKPHQNGASAHRTNAEAVGYGESIHPSSAIRRHSGLL